MTEEPGRGTTLGRLWTDPSRLYVSSRAERSIRELLDSHHGVQDHMHEPLCRRGLIHMCRRRLWKSRMSVLSDTQLTRYRADQAIKPLTPREERTILVARIASEIIIYSGTT
jgi:hypothetical protein